MRQEDIDALREAGMCVCECGCRRRFVNLGASVHCVRCYTCVHNNHKDGYTDPEYTAQPKSDRPSVRWVLEGLLRHLHEQKEAVYARIVQTERELAELDRTEREAFEAKEHERLMEEAGRLAG